MATLQAQLQKAQALKSNDVVNAIFRFIKTIEAELVELNRLQLFEKSEGITGDALGFYSKATEFITTNEALLGKGTKIKRAGEPFDLEQTGVFLDNLYAKVSNGVITFGSSDPKTDEILENPSLLTKSLFGLTEDNLNLFIRNTLLPFYQKYNRQKLDL